MKCIFIVCKITQYSIVGPKCLFICFVSLFTWHCCQYQTTVETNPTIWIFLLAAGVMECCLLLKSVYLLCFSLCLSFTEATSALGSNLRNRWESRHISRWSVKICTAKIPNALPCPMECWTTVWYGIEEIPSSVKNDSIIWLFFCSFQTNLLHL